MKKNIILAIFLSVFIQSVQAVPSTVSYQGYLTDPSGSPINATVSIVFSLYDADSSGSLSWMETQTTVTVSKGLFKVQLGSITPFASGQFDIPMWLGIKVGADAEMSPLQALNSVGYALKAEDAETLAGLNPADLDQSSHVSDTTNPHNVSPTQIGAASATALNSHVINTANPHNVTAVQMGAATATQLTEHSNATSAHHGRYTNSEAISAMSAKADNNPLHHDQYTDSAAVLAIKANDGAGSTLDADLIDGMEANELIDAASDEVRTPISNLSYTISSAGSYYLTQSFFGAGGINIEADNVTLDLMGFTIDGNARNDYGIDLNGHSGIVIKNGSVIGFGYAGIYNSSGSSRGIVLEDLQLIGNGSLGTTGSYSGIFLGSTHSRVERCFVKDSGGFGIRVTTSAIIKNNIVENTGGFYGIFSSSSSIVTGNTVSNTQGSYAIYSSQGSKITNNTVFNNQGNYGILAKSGSLIKDNVVYSNQGLYGIYASAGSNVINNTAYSNQGWGIFAVSSNVIIGNTVYINNRAQKFNTGGIRIGNNSLVESNTANSNYETGIYVSSSDNVLRKNHATDSISVTGVSRCIHFVSSDNAAVDNTATGCVTEFSGATIPVTRFIGNIGW